MVRFLTPLSTMENRPPIPDQGRETRARKRRRLCPPAPFTEPASLPRPKRSRSGTIDNGWVEMTRKRRRSSLATGPSPPLAKRLRSSDAPDVEMVDIDPSKSTGPRRRKKLLRDMLRAEKVSRAALRELRLQRREGTSAADVGATAPAPATGPAERRRRLSSVDSVTGLTGDEEVCEVIDASENTDPNVGAGDARSSYSANGPAEPSVQAVLLEDGLCAVHIVRADGTMQTVVIQPPGVDDERW